LDDDETGKIRVLALRDKKSSVTHEVPRNGQFVPRNQNAPGNPFRIPRNGGNVPRNTDPVPGNVLVPGKSPIVPGNAKMVPDAVFLSKSRRNTVDA
jgi:hypothetical protein